MTIKRSRGFQGMSEQLLVRLTKQNSSNHSFIIFYLSSTPDEDHASKVLVFLTVLYESSYRSVHFSSLELFFLFFW